MCVCVCVRNVRRGNWGVWMWRWWILAPPHLTTNTMNPWCQHATTELQRSYWVHTQLSHTRMHTGWQNMSSLVKCQIIHYFCLCVFVHRSGLEPDVWCLESGLRSPGVLPGTYTLLGTVLFSHTHPHTRTHPEIVICFSTWPVRYFRPTTVKNIWPWWRKSWDRFPPTCWKRPGNHFFFLSIHHLSQT